MSTKATFIASCVAVVMATTAAVTQAENYPAPTDWITVRQVIDKVEAAGYSDIREIERDDGMYEVKVVTQDGQRMELYLDRKTGEILNRERR